MTHTFLLEVGLEEMPAQDVEQAEKQIVNKTESFLKNEKLSFEGITGYSTPRRFAVKIHGLAEKQPDEMVVVRGPSQKIAQDEEGNWTKAAIGFSKGQGGTVDELIIKDHKGEPYVYFEKSNPGKLTFEILKKFNQIIPRIEFSKNMKWGDQTYQYIRPIHWLVALLDEKVVPFEVFEIPTDRISYGHRFLGGEIKLNNSHEYEEKLKKQYVIANRSKRKEMIVKQIDTLCKKNNWQSPTDYTALLDEVTDLVEYPTAFYGKFEESFLDVPEVVLETSMIDHQRYFPVRDNNHSNNLLPFFISVRNGNEDYIQSVAKGNEKVLSARLADATFFYHEDQNYSIDDYIDQLKRVIYYENLGSIYDKQLRAIQMVSVINDVYNLSDDKLNDLKRTASIYKFDLVTQIVDEFPVLQGTIGEIYANERDESKVVSNAIGSQYLPLSATDKLPETEIGKYIALIDKLDTLIQFFSINMIPTGSNDPHALRRDAIGIVRLIIDLDNRQIDLTRLLDQLIEVSDIPAEHVRTLEDNKKDLTRFILIRLENIMENKYKISYDIRKSVLGANHKNLPQLLDAAIVLEDKKEKSSFKEIAEAVTRVLNITKNQGSSGKVSKQLIQTESEKELVQVVSDLESTFTITMTADEKYQLLQKIAPIISAFFDDNMIMVDEVDIKENRLTLLHNLANITKRYADFSQLVI